MHHESMMHVSLYFCTVALLHWLANSATVHVALLHCCTVACCILHVACHSHMPRATCDMLHATYVVHHRTCNMQHATCTLEVGGLARAENEGEVPRLQEKRDTFSFTFICFSGEHLFFARRAFPCFAEQGLAWKWIGGFP